MQTPVGCVMYRWQCNVKMINTGMDPDWSSVGMDTEMDQCETRMVNNLNTTANIFADANKRGPKYFRTISF